MHRPDRKQGFAPAAHRNREPICEALERLLPRPAGEQGAEERGRLLEIASGTGQHVVFFAERLPGWDFQPSDVDAAALESVEAYRAESGLPNVRPAVALDVTEPGWELGLAAVDAVLCSNLVHIAPWAAAEGLLAGAGGLLAAGGRLLLYGPFRFHGVFTAPSNEAFDRSLRERDGGWGVRDVDDLDRVAAAAGLRRAQTVALPANNHLLVYERAPGAV